MMKRLRRFADLSLLPAIVWLALQIFVSTQSTQASPAIGDVSGGGEYVTSDFVEVVICTQYGFKTIKIAPNGKIPEGETNSPDCRLCQSICNPAVGLARSVDTIPVFFSSIGPLPFQLVWAHSPTPELSPFRSRAPPL
ncbi:MAG: hypothetical protein K8F25_13025 [Fimbriimonadaceae bacterium]|nr:hypothetical protein [Alphaproteobacteria bacterium]